MSTFKPRQFFLALACDGYDPVPELTRIPMLTAYRDEGGKFISVGRVPTPHGHTITLVTDYDPAATPRKAKFPESEARCLMAVVLAHYLNPKAGTGALDEIVERWTGTPARRVRAARRGKLAGRVPTRLPTILIGSGRLANRTGRTPWIALFRSDAEKKAGIIEGYAWQGHRIKVLAITVR